MPVDRRALLQLSLLILAVPCQYFISKYWTHSNKQQASAIKDLLKSFHDTTSNLGHKYLNWDSWKHWCQRLLTSFTRIGEDGQPKAHVDVNRAERASSHSAQSEDEGESPAVDVLKHRNPDGYFAGSSVPRSPRSSKIQYRVGQVIRHRIWGYRGVIIGWDDTARAPDFWLHHNHPEDKPHWREMANYAILVDSRDRGDGQITYVPQENIEIISETKVNSPHIHDYFTAFDGVQYLPRKWLRSLYPHD